MLNTKKKCPVEEHLLKLDQGLVFERRYFSNQFVNIFRYYSVSYHSARIGISYVQSNSVFTTRADKIFYEIHTTFGFNPLMIQIRFFGFDYNIEFQKHTAIESKVTKGCEPCGGTRQLVTDYKGHLQVSYTRKYSFRNL